MKICIATYFPQILIIEKFRNISEADRLLCATAAFLNRLLAKPALRAIEFVPRNVTVLVPFGIFQQVAADNIYFNVNFAIPDLQFARLLCPLVPPPSLPTW